MNSITLENAAQYLRHAGHVTGSQPVSVRELPGGVSNAVFLVTLPESGEQFVLKQARERLRVREEWLCPVERIWREVETLRVCGAVLEARSTDRGAGSGGESEYGAQVPGILWEDRENYCYAMTAAAEGHRTWKEMLLAGEMGESAAIADACGRLLGTLHAGSWEDENVASQLDDRMYFDQLRIDPYYRQIARVHPELGPHIDRLIESVWTHRRCLIHGDFSPKNLLVWPGHVLLIDFEVGHYGDPAFDLGFFLTHLFLKSLWAGPRRGEYLRVAETFWNAYCDVLAGATKTTETPGAGLLPASEEQRVMWNLAGCLLARVDGKSPVEYLSREQQAVVRRIAKAWLAAPPPEFAAAIRAWVESLPP